ncbi:MAG: hypothetical protein WKH64_13130 [Chloroflexia bacterium]
MEVDLPTEHGGFTLIGYAQSGARNPTSRSSRACSGPEPPLVRLHSECLTGMCSAPSLRLWHAVAPGARSDCGRGDGRGVIPPTGGTRDRAA